MISAVSAASPYDSLRRELRILVELSGGPRLRDLSGVGRRLYPERPFSTGTISNVLTGKRERIDWVFVHTLVSACAAYACRERVPVTPADYDLAGWNARWRACTRTWWAAHPGAGTDWRFDPDLNPAGSRAVVPRPPDRQRRPGRPGSASYRSALLSLTAGSTS